MGGDFVALYSALRPTTASIAWLTRILSPLSVIRHSQAEPGRRSGIDACRAGAAPSRPELAEAK